MARSEHEQMVVDCDVRRGRLTQWEREFCESIDQRLKSGKPLTEKQTDTLNTIWEKATEKG